MISHGLSLQTTLSTLFISTELAKCFFYLGHEFVKHLQKLIQVNCGAERFGYRKTFGKMCAVHLTLLVGKRNAALQKIAQRSYLALTGSLAFLRVCRLSIESSARLAFEYISKLPLAYSLKAVTAIAPLLHVQRDQKEGESDDLLRRPFILQTLAFYKFQRPFMCCLTDQIRARPALTQESGRAKQLTMMDFFHQGHRAASSFNSFGFRSDGNENISKTFGNAK